MEIGCTRRVARGDRHLGEAAVSLGHRHDLACGGGVHVHFAGEVPVVAPRSLREIVTTLLERPCQASRVERKIRFRQVGHRGLDDRVGETRLKVERDRVPHRPFEPHQVAAIEIAPIPGEPEHSGIARPEVDQLRRRASGDYSSRPSNRTKAWSRSRESAPTSPACHGRTVPSATGHGGGPSPRDTCPPAVRRERPVRRPGSTDRDRRAPGACRC